MGQKVNPNGLRVGISTNWNTQWITTKKLCPIYLKEDYLIRKLIKTDYSKSYINKITIERIANKIIINIYAVFTSLLIGKQGAEIENIKNKIAKITKTNSIFINIKELKHLSEYPQLVAEEIAMQLEKRISFKRAVKYSMEKAIKTGIKGIKVSVGGRLDGAEIARTEHYSEGSVPLQTLKANIEYGFAEAHTIFGVIGVKCWIYKQDSLLKKANKSNIKKEFDKNVNA